MSLLGTLFTQQVQSGAPTTAPAGQPQPAVRSPRPCSTSCPHRRARTAYQTAITNGVHQVFLWAAVIALVAVFAAWAIREVPLRGTVTT